MEVVLVECGDVATSGFKFCDRYVLTVDRHLPKTTDILVRTDAAEGAFDCADARIARHIRSGTIESCAEQVFAGWSVGPRGGGVSKEVLSRFVVLDLEGGDGDPEPALEELKRAVEGAEGSVSRGREVFVESVPFGSKHFIGSRSRGIVSGVVGRDSCFVLTDCPTVPGSEGSPVFVREGSRETPIALVVASLAWWRGEWIGLTLCVGLLALLRETLADRRPNASAPAPVGERRLALVICGGARGTGIVVDEDRGFLVTNAHVVEGGRRVELRWGGRMFDGEVVYATPEGCPCDLAMLRAGPGGCKGMQRVEFAEKEAVRGEPVYAVGYSLIPPKLNPEPLVSRGTISHVAPAMLKTTCCVHPGFSGGALFRPNGELLGVVVSNAKLLENGVSFPRMNMCIPLSAISGVIREFLQTEDVKILHQLGRDWKQWRAWTVLESKL